MGVAVVELCNLQLSDLCDFEAIRSFYVQINTAKANIIFFQQMIYVSIIKRHYLDDLRSL